MGKRFATYHQYSSPFFITIIHHHLEIAERNEVKNGNCA